ncbi:hypothetical protein A3733_22895 [Pseudoalteromonas shioyasakiensis]|nr:hypothetical protein A3733_22895 [Pseudoalteromonas shioyasakiensis]
MITVVKYFTRKNAIVRKRKILYPDIILHRRALLRQLEKAGSRKRNESKEWEQLINSIHLDDIGDINHNNTFMEVIEAIATPNSKISKREAIRYMRNLYNFIKNLDHISYETWKGHCRKVRSREGKRTLTVEHSILEKVCTYLETTHQKTFDPHAIGKNEFQEAIETLLYDANNRKNI